MTISNQQIRANYTGDNSSTSFPIPFPFYLATDIDVLLAGVTQTSGYTISGGVDASGNPQPGTCVFASAPATATPVLLLLNVPLTQLVQLVDGTAFQSATLNQVNDRAVQALLRVQDLLSRAIVAPDGDVSPLMALPPAAQRANLFMTYDGAGNLLLTSAGPGTNNTQATLGPILNPLTAAEAAAGVTPVNSVYPPYHAWRYLTAAQVADVVAGTLAHDCTAGLNNWLKVAQTVTTAGFPLQSFKGAYLPGGVYLISGPLGPVTGSKVRIYGDGSDVSRLVVQGGSNSFTVLQIGNNVPTTAIVFNIHVEGIGILRQSGSGAITLMKVINTQYSHYTDITLYDNTGVANGVGLYYAGHENNVFENILSINTIPIELGNPSLTLGDGCDHTTFLNLEIQSSNDTQPLISVVNTPLANVGNMQFIGNQVWLGGNYGFYYNDTGSGSSIGVGGDLLFENIRREQTSTSSVNETIYIKTGGSSGGPTNNYMTNVVVRNSTLGLVSTLSGGLHFDGVLYVTVDNVNLSVGGVGVTMIARSGAYSTQLTTINTNLDPNASSFTNMEKVFGSNDAVLPLAGGTVCNPQTCIYQYTDVNTQTQRGMRVHEARKWLGSRSGVVASGGSFIIPGSSTSTAIVTIGVSAGSGTIEGGTFICSGSNVVLMSGTTNVAAAITAGKISVTWSGGSGSYVVTNQTTSARNITVSVEWM